LSLRDISDFNSRGQLLNLWCHWRTK